MPMMMPPMANKLELTVTGERTNLLGFVCVKYELKQRGQVMEIWATDQLIAFQPYFENQPDGFGMRRLEEQWGDSLKAKKLFPLLAILRFEHLPAQPGNRPPAASPERMRFEVKSVKPGKMTDDSLFQPPPDYLEIQPLRY